ncbi:MAG: lipase family protein, partial [Chitinophagales bacterium]
ESASNSEEINLRNWAIKDMTGAVKLLKESYPNQKLYFFGHSIGGQIVGLMENHHLIERFVFFSSTTGHWTVFDFPMNLMTIFMFYLHIPITTRLFGYMSK